MKNEFDLSQIEHAKGIRGFFSEKEIEEIKGRVIAAILAGEFLNFEEIQDGEYRWVSTQLKSNLKEQVRDTVKEMFDEKVKEIAEQIIKPQIEGAVASLVTRFVKQTEEIVNKINWHWSIK